MKNLRYILNTVILLILTSAFVFAQTQGNKNSTADFDGDGKTDISVFRPSNGTWYIKKSSGGFAGFKWGNSTDKPLTGDYDGDGKSDILAFRKGKNFLTEGIVNNSWYLLKSSDNGLIAKDFGTSSFGNDGEAAPADYDGDGKIDIAYVTIEDSLPAPSYFVVLQSSDGREVSTQWGTNMDVRVQADYDGDGKADLAVYRSSTYFGSEAGTWYILQSSNGAMRAEKFGLPTDKAVQADYDGDGKVDIAVYRPSNGMWYVKNSIDGSVKALQFGVASDVTVQGDYDGDGKADFAVYRPSNGVWYFLKSTEGFAAEHFGAKEDIPLPNAATRQ